MLGRRRPPPYCPGFRSTRCAKRTVISRNHVRGAGQDGINVLSRSTTLTRNRTVRNADLGIQAVKGVIDGGGNRPAGTGIRASA